jgi:hypothetical protein
MSEGWIEVGYDGDDEPVPNLRPLPNFRGARSPDARWRSRLLAAEWFLTEYKAPVGGEPDSDRSGGLKLLNEVFGRLSFAGNLSEDVWAGPEVIHSLRQVAPVPVVAGLLEPGNYASRTLHGYPGAVAVLSAALAPDEHCAPEMYWQDGVLRLSETSGSTVRTIRALAGPEALRKTLDGLDRTRPHIVRVQMGHHGIQVKPPGDGPRSPVRYGYDNPKMPRLPAEQLRPSEEVERQFRTERETLDVLAGFVASNPGSGFQSIAALAEAANGADPSRTVDLDTLRSAARNLLDRWSVTGNHPPTYTQSGGRYFSLSEMYQLLAAALGKRGKSVARTPVYGPLEFSPEQGPSSGTVQRAALEEFCRRVSGGLDDPAWREVPGNAIPGWAEIGGLRLNAAQTLRMMAQALTSDAASFGVDTCQMTSEAGMLLPTTRLNSEMGTSWSLKPAPLRLTVVASEPKTGPLHARTQTAGPE